MESRNELVLKESFNNLRNKKVILIGAGGAANFLLPLLTKFPLKLTIFDGDLIEESNLERQIFFTKIDVGKNKAEVLSTKFDVNPVPVFVTKDNIHELIKLKPDLVIDCTDNFKFRKLILNNYKTNFSWIFSAVSENRGQVYLIDKNEAIDLNPLINKNEVSASNFGVTNYSVALLSSLVSSLCVDFLGKKKKLNTMIRFNLDDYSFININLK